MNKILLLIEDINKRFQIKQILNSDCSIDIQDKINLDSEQFDLCITDLSFLNKYAELFNGQKEKKDSYLPIIVASERNNIKLVYDRFGKIIDELILIPVDETELKVRISLLLKLKKLLPCKTETERSRHNNYLLDQIQRMTHLGCWEFYKETSPCIKWSDEMFRIYGISKDLKPTVDMFIQMIHPDDRDITRLWTENTISGQKMDAHDFRVIRPDGTERVIKGSGGPVFDNSGNVIGAIGTAQDITEQKTVEKKLVQESNLSRQLVDSLPGIFYLFNRDGRYLRWNEQHKIISKYSDEELAKLNPLDFFDSEDKKRVAQRIEKVFKTGCGSVEAKFVTKDGRKIDYYFTGRRIIYDNQLCLIGVGIDISERKKIEKALYENEQKLRLFIEHAPVSIAIFDNEMNYLMVSRKWVTGYHLENLAIIGKSHYEIFPEISNEWKDVHKRALKGENVRCEEDRFERHNGSIQWLRWEVRPWYTVNRIIGGVIIFVEDITERKNYEKRLKESVHQKENLIQELYHRTKNNMQVISALIELQAASSNNKEIKKMVQSSQNRIRIMALAHEKLYKSESLSNINMKEYVTDAVQLIMDSYELEKNKIYINFDMEDVKMLIDVAIPCGLVIKELFTNSLEHAFPENSKGKIYIGLHKNNNIFELVIGDNGIGVKPDIDLMKSKTLGIKLVIQIVKHQLHGKIRPQINNGLWWYINFRGDIYSKRV